MNLRQPFSVMFLVLMLNACSKQTKTLKNSKAEAAGLAGTWQWLRTDGGIAFNIHQTPASTGKQVALVLSTDSSYSIYTNNAVSSQGTYSLTPRTCIHDRTEKPFLKFSADGGMMVERQHGDTLELSDENYDGVGSQYVRASGAIK